MTRRQDTAADNWLILGSLFTVLLLNMLTLSHYDFTHWRPDFVAVGILYWAVHRPNKFSMALAFFMGIVMDVHSGVLLGQYAIVYVLLCFLGVVVHRRLMWFGLWPQALQILPIFLVVQLLITAIRLLLGGALPPITIFIAPMLQAFIWPLLCVLLSRIEGVIHDREDKLSL